MRLFRLFIHITLSILHTLSADDLPGGALVDQAGQELKLVIGVVDCLGRRQQAPVLGLRFTPK